MASGSALAPVFALLAYVVFAGASIVLTLVDIRIRRLPDAIVVPTFAAVLVLFLAAALTAGDPTPLLRALGGATIAFAGYLLVSLASRGGMGFGDVKLAAVVGLATAWTAWSAVIVATVSAFVLAGVLGLVLLALRRAGRDASVPFGPWMLVGAWIGILAGPAIWAWYGVLAGLPTSV